ncbi:hypothetical protein PGA94_09125 [Pediococcus pentosaceus]|uniref:hypothetical protein n=1 Tax=Pediococcus pentosaceus TaxID=1255 RepID=UPI00232D7757|nr:hypothetical protein [Pediococcus pentosaceus]MDB1562934.1 hypothetical protein [Pediococcus pentosaceus]
MKLVKINEDLYLNSDFIKYVEADGEESTLITTISGGTLSLDLPIKKVLDTISGSEEQSTEKSYSGVSKDGSVMNVITSNKCATVTLESNNECMGWKLNRKKVSKKK